MHMTDMPNTMATIRQSQRGIEHTLNLDRLVINEQLHLGAERRRRGERPAACGLEAAQALRPASSPPELALHHCHTCVGKGESGCRESLGGGIEGVGVQWGVRDEELKLEVESSPSRYGKALGRGSWAKSCEG